MKLTDCVDEIKKIYFTQESTEGLNKFVLYLLQELKYKHFVGKEYPRHGWLLSFEENEVKLVHKEAYLDVGQLIERSIPGAKNYLYLFGQQSHSL